MIIPKSTELIAVASYSTISFRCSTFLSLFVVVTFTIPRSGFQGLNVACNQINGQCKADELVCAQVGQICALSCHLAYLVPALQPPLASLLSPNAEYVNRKSFLGPVFAVQIFPALD